MALKQLMQTFSKPSRTTAAVHSYRNSATVIFTELKATINALGTLCLKCRLCNGCNTVFTVENGRQLCCCKVA